MVGNKRNTTKRNLSNKKNRKTRNSNRRKVGTKKKVSTKRRVNSNKSKPNSRKMKGQNGGWGPPSDRRTSYLPISHQVGGWGEPRTPNNYSRRRKRNKK